MDVNFTTTYKRLLQSTNYKHHRYMYNGFNIENRLTGLIGPRGTGKTTLLLQYIKEKMNEKDECIYISADHIYFSKHYLIDFINDRYEDYGVRYFFIDEVHKYPNWNQELKNAYDSLPDIHIVFSGSSSIDLIKGTYDLSRRGVLFRIEGMSFREYLKFNDIIDLNAISLEEILDKRSGIEEKLASIKKLKAYFKAYLKGAYYPFFLEDKNSYHQKIQRIIDKAVFEDISNFYKLKTENLSSFKRILAYAATIPPGNLNINNISKNIGLDNKTVLHYLQILKETGLVELLYKNKTGGRLLRSAEKIYLDNQDLYSAISEETGYKAHIGTLREIFFIKMVKNSGHKIYYSETGDFEINGTIFEIGGKNKDKKQIKNDLNSAFLVKDDILYGSRHELPLYLFGFLY